MTNDQRRRSTRVLCTSGCIRSKLTNVRLSVESAIIRKEAAGMVAEPIGGGLPQPGPVTLPTRRRESFLSNRQIGHRARAAFGFTCAEVMVVAFIMVVVSAIALPFTQGVFYMYRLRAAATNAALTIQATRYHAIMQSYPYQIAFSATTNSYQILSEVPPANTFSNVGGAIPIDPGGVSTVNATTTFQFSPGGTVTLVGGSMPATFMITNPSGTKTITVSSVGDVTVTP